MPMDSCQVSYFYRLNCPHSNSAGCQEENDGSYFWASSVLQDGLNLLVGICSVLLSYPRIGVFHSCEFAYLFPVEGDVIPLIKMFE